MIRKKTRKRSSGSFLDPRAAGAAAREISPGSDAHSGTKGAQLWSVSALGQELGLNYRTVRRRLRDVEPAGYDRRGKRPLYRLRDVFPVILTGLPQEADAWEQRARLHAAQADKTEHEVANLRARLIPAATAREQWARMRKIANASLLAIVGQVAPRVLLCTSLAQVRELLDTEVRRALTELGASSTARRVARGP